MYACINKLTGILAGSGNRATGLVAQAVRDYGGEDSDYEIVERSMAEVVALAEQRTAQTHEGQMSLVYSSRVNGYGSIGDQLDMIFHDGLDAWKTHIAAVKAANPKPGE